MTTRGFVFAAVCVAAASVSARDLHPADFCMLVHVADGKHADVWKKLDGFTEQKGMWGDNSHALVRNYYDTKERFEVRAQADLTDGERRKVGVVVTYFQLRESPGLDVGADLRGFVKDSIAPEWKTTPCENVAGLERPHIIK